MGSHTNSAPLLAGKTLLVEKLAAEARVPLLCLSPSGVLSKWAGESEKALRGAFEAAAALSPAILFIDEVDSLAPARLVCMDWVQHEAPWLGLHCTCDLGLRIAGALLIPRLEHHPIISGPAATICRRDACSPSFSFR